MDSLRFNNNNNKPLSKQKAEKTMYKTTFSHHDQSITSIPLRNTRHYRTENHTNTTVADVHVLYRGGAVIEVMFVRAQIR